MTTEYLKARVVLVLSAAGLAAGLMIAPAHAAGDTKGPACADIVDGVGVWNGTTVTFGLTTAKPACKQVTYTVYATPEAPGSATVSSTTYTIDSLGRLVFSLPVADPDPSTPCSLVDVYAATVMGKQHIADRAPDAGAAQIPDDPNCPTPSRDFH